MGPDQIRAIDNLKERIAFVEPENLREVYKQQMEWARHFNQLIWVIGGILVPVALAGLALSFRNDKGVFLEYQFIFVASASVFLLLAWNLYADWHRNLWQRAFTLTGLIEIHWGLRPQGQISEDLPKHPLQVLTPIDWGKWVRWGWWILVLIAWVLRAIVEFNP